MHSPLKLESLLNEPLDWRFRAFPDVGKKTIGDVPSSGWNLFRSGFFFPVMALKETALAHNLALMARLSTEQGFDLAPHGKTTMAPQLFARQLDAGSWAITAASMEHVRIYRAFGVPRILLANELVRADEARWVAEELAKDPAFDFFVYVDSPGVARLLDEAFATFPRKPRVLIELGVQGGRSGCRTVADALALARDVASFGNLSLGGVAGFEGLLGTERTSASLAAVDAFCDRIAELAREIVAGRLATEGEFLVSAGGSAFPDRVIQRFGALRADIPGVRLVLRSGCYVTHDEGLYESLSPYPARGSSSGAPGLRPALELWAAVLSRPEPDTAIVGFGKRDAPFDAGLPIPHAVRDAAGRAERPADAMSVVKLNDQHAYLRVSPGDPLAPGDLLGFGISHPCLAFDKWSLLPVVNDDYDVVEAIRTYF